MEQIERDKAYIKLENDYVDKQIANENYQDWDGDECGEFDDDEDYESDEFEDAMDNCGMMGDGTCLHIGSEQCDFECPFSFEMWSEPEPEKEIKPDGTQLELPI